MEIKTSFIRKRGNNYNVYIEYLGEDGKLKQKSIGKYTIKKDANKHLIEIKNSLNNNKFIVPKDITLVDRCYKYIYDPNKKLSPETIEIRESIINNNVKSFFKDTKLSEITPTLLQSYVNSIHREYTKSSSQHRVRIVTAVLKECFRLREINDNIVQYIVLPESLKKDKEIQEPYDRDEVRYIIEKLNNTAIEIPILLMLTMGLRTGEVGGLRWQDIDFVNNTISVNQVLIYSKGGKIQFKEPKTKTSIRTISAPPELILKLKKWKVQHNKYRLEDILDFPDIVCLNRNLRPWTEQTLLRSFKRFASKIGARTLSLHSLRHTHITMLVLAKVDFKTISARVGHSDIKITLNRYSHVLKEMDYNASENISNIMFK